MRWPAHAALLAVFDGADVSAALTLGGNASEELPFGLAVHLMPFPPGRVDRALPRVPAGFPTPHHAQRDSNCCAAGPVVAAHAAQHGLVALHTHVSSSCPHPTLAG
jgi:hypothetical protein